MTCIDRSATNDNALASSGVRRPSRIAVQIESNRREYILRVVDRRHDHRDRLALARRPQPIENHAQARDVAGLGQGQCLLNELLGSTPCGLFWDPRPPFLW